MKSYTTISKQNGDTHALEELNQVQKAFEKIVECNISQTLRVLMEINAEKRGEEMLLKQVELVKDLKKKKGIQEKPSIFGDSKDALRANILALMEKTKTEELFVDLGGQDGQQQFQPTNYKKIIEYKKNKYLITALLEKIKLVLNLKAVDRLLYVKLIQKKIQLTKRLFILEIEQGDEVFIPQEISIDSYPLSFRFYDFILNFTTDSVSQQTKNFHCHKNTFRLNYYQNENVQRKLLE